MVYCGILLVYLLIPAISTQLIPGTFTGNPGTGSESVPEGTLVGFECDITEQMALIQIYAKMDSIKHIVAESSNDSSLSLYFNINRTLHNVRFSCKAFWTNSSEAYKSGEKWYKVLFAVTQITLTTSVTGSVHIFEENQAVLVTCSCNEGHPIPEIVWSRDGGGLDDPEFESVEEMVEDGEFEYKTVSSTLSITTHDFMNQAVYVCQVKDMEELQQNYSMTVLFPPGSNNLEISPEDAVREDNWLTVTCAVAPSNPMPDIEWFLGDSLVTNTSSETELEPVVAWSEMYHARGRQSSVKIKVTEDRVGTAIECRVFYQDKELTNLTESHTLEIKKVSDVLIFAVAAVGATVTLVIIITVIIVLCHRRKRTPKKKKSKPQEAPEDRYEYIIDAFSVDGDKDQSKPTAQGLEMRGQSAQAKSNDYTRESTSSMSYENWDRCLDTLDQLHLPTMVNEGRYATVKAGYPKQGCGLYPQQYVAAKILKGHSKSYMKEIFLSQLQAMQVVKSHDNVLELLAFINTKKQLALISQYYENSDLQGFLRSRDSDCNITSRDLIGMALDVASAMKFLSSHQPPFLHHQLSGSHVLVGPRMLCKVTGFAMEESVHQREKLESKHKLEVDIRWKAPELLRHTSLHAVQSDVWSFGVLLYEITTFGSVPYPGLSPDAVKTFVSSGDHMARPGFVSSDMYEIMKKCWSWQQYDRPSFAFLVTQLERLQADPYQHIDVSQIFKPYINGHMHGGKSRRNYENVGL